jgi:hypothetical protein
MIAVTGDGAILASIGLHRAMGFEPAGALPATGWKHGRWADTVLTTRPLGEGAATPPVGSSAVRACAERAWRGMCPPCPTARTAPMTSPR